MQIAPVQFTTGCEADVAEPCLVHVEVFTGAKQLTGTAADHMRAACLLDKNSRWCPRNDGDWMKKADPHRDVIESTFCAGAIQVVCDIVETLSQRADEMLRHQFLDVLPCLF